MQNKEQKPLRRARRIGDAQAGSPRAKLEEAEIRQAQRQAESERRKEAKAKEKKRANAYREVVRKEQRRQIEKGRLEKEAPVRKLRPKVDDSEKIPLRIDARTVLLIRPDQDPEEVRQRWLNRQAS